MKIEQGVMVMKDGKAWGKTYADGHTTEYGWMEPEDAPIHNPQFCTKPESVVSPHDKHYLEKLRGAQVISVERRTQVIIKSPT